MPGKHAPAVERFWRHVQKGEDCWNWTGSIKAGYGQFKVNRAPIRAHRFSWELHFGAIVPDLLVCHHCDNPRCVRPDHLFLGSHLNNTQDMIRKGRKVVHTPDRPLSRAFLDALRERRRKVSDEQVRTIRQRYAAGGVSMRKLGAEYGIDHSTVVRIVGRRHFAEVA